MKLTREAIRRQLHASPNTHLVGDPVLVGTEREPRLLRPAAVLVPLVDRPEELTVLLTQRTEHLVHHPGQVSFPGGRVEAHDTGPIETALRETEEEIGLDRRHVEIAGFMDLYQTVTGFVITPVVGFVAPPFTLAPDPFEVAEAFEVPLSHVLNPANHERRSGLFQGRRREYDVVLYKDYNIWGATAAMLVKLSKALAEGQGLADG